MIFPIGDDQVKGGSWPIFSYAFIAVNILVFVMLQLNNEVFTYANSAVPYEITTGEDLISQQGAIPHFPGPVPIYLTLLYSIFMHSGWMHLVGNMVFLWVFADNIESTVGSRNFILFYILGGLAATFSHIATDPTSIIPSLGASGAIAACLGAYLIMFPKSKVKVLFFIRIFSVPAFLFLGFWIVQQVIRGMGSLCADGGGVAWFAHIGGFAFGVVAGIYFRFRYPKVQLARAGYRSVNRSASRYNNRYITNRIKPF
jgi:membrane associated rhomboid family serine protease